MTPATKFENNTNTNANANKSNINKMLADINKIISTEFNQLMDKHELFESTSMAVLNLPIVKQVIYKYEKELKEQASPDFKENVSTIDLSLLHEVSNMQRNIENLTNIVIKLATEVAYLKKNIENKEVIVINDSDEDLEDVEGLGPKGIQEIRKILSNYGITLK